MTLATLWALSVGVSERVLRRIGEEGERENSGWVKLWARGFMLCHGRSGRLVLASTKLWTYLAKKINRCLDWNLFLYCCFRY